MDDNKKIIGKGILKERPHADREAELEGFFDTGNHKYQILGWVHFEKDGKISIILEEKQS